MNDQINSLVNTIIRFIQITLNVLMSNPLALLAALFLLLIGQKGGVKIGNSSLTVGK